MASQETQLVLSGMTDLDLAELRQELLEAGMQPDEFLFVERPSSKPDSHNEPVTVTIVLGLAKVIVPAVATVISTWLVNRGGSGRKRAGQVRLPNGKTRSVDVGELAKADAPAFQTRLVELYDSQE